MSSLRQNWIFMQQSPKLKGHWRNHGNSKETDSNHLCKSCDPECKKHVPVVNKNCYMMTGEIWRGEVLFHSKLWTWGSKEKSIEKREKEWKREQVPKETKPQPRWWQGKIYVFLSCSFLPSHWQHCGRSLKAAGKHHLSAGTCVSRMFRYDHLLVG